MNTLYLDLVSGISGDMFVGALLDLGVDFRSLEQALSGLGIAGYHLHVKPGMRNGIAGTKFDVHLEGGHHHAQHQPAAAAAIGGAIGAGGESHSHAHHHPSEAAPEHGHEHDHSAGHPAPTHAPTHPSEHRDFADIRRLIESSRLSDWVKEKAVAVFRRIAEAEGKIHGKPPEAVHFHEVGAVDSLVDIVGGCLALEWLGKPRILASFVVDGTGWVDCAHGRFPVPTPATLEILTARGVPLSQCDEPHELVTPTGAALLAELVEEFGPLQQWLGRRIGYGLGSRIHRTRPNVLRVLWGETPVNVAPAAHDWETDSVAVLETNLDDVTPEILGHFAERALAAGALDVFFLPIQMKKGRPGSLLTVLCPASEADAFSTLILTETSAFGVRRSMADRRKLRREFREAATPYGTVRLKLGWLDGRVLQAAPEYEDCRKAAQQAGVPLKSVYEAALQAARPSPEVT